MKKRKLNLKKVSLLGIIIIALGIGGIYVLTKKSTDNKTVTPTTIKNEPENEFATLTYYRKENLSKYEQYKQSKPSLSIEDIVTHVNMHIDKPFFSDPAIEVTNPDEINVLVNKVYKLPSGWAPTDLVLANDPNVTMERYSSAQYKEQTIRKLVYTAFDQLRAKCKAEGITLYAVSGYRSFEFQQKIYDNMIKTYGQEYTDRYVSRPGQSEHATGLVIDVTMDNYDYNALATHPKYAWFVEQLADYGFIIRYPEGKEELTGYAYEAWHLRYLGVDLAKKVVESNLTYDEYIARK